MRLPTENWIEMKSFFFVRFAAITDVKDDMKEQLPMFVKDSVKASWLNDLTLIISAIRAFAMRLNVFSQLVVTCWKLNVVIVGL